MLPQIFVGIVVTVIAVGLSQYTGEYELTGFAAFHSVFGVFLGFVVRKRRAAHQDMCGNRLTSIVSRVQFGMDVSNAMGNYHAGLCAVYAINGQMR